MILYQAGYLTIDKQIIDDENDIIEYKLKLPNKEVKNSFNDYIIATMYKNTNPNEYKRSLRASLKKSNLESFKIL